MLKETFKNLLIGVSITTNDILIRYLNMSEAKKIQRKFLSIVSDL